MFEKLINCKIDELQYYAEEYAKGIKKEDVELFIRTLWKRVPELSDEQEKELHKLGRKVRKQFNMKPIHL